MSRVFCFPLQSVAVISHISKYTGVELCDTHEISILIVDHYATIPVLPIASRFGTYLVIYNTTRCDYFTARCIHEPRISNVLLRVVKTFTSLQRVAMCVGGVSIKQGPLCQSK